MPQQPDSVNELRSHWFPVRRFPPLDEQLIRHSAAKKPASAVEQHRKANQPRQYENATGHRYLTLARRRPFASVPDQLGDVNFPGREIPDGPGVRRNAGHDCTRTPLGVFPDGEGSGRALRTIDPRLPLLNNQSRDTYRRRSV
jgi:hypothetical protein